VLSSRKLSRQGINSSKAHKRTSHLSLLGSLEQKRKLSSNTFPFKLQKLTPYFFPTAAHPILCKPPRKEPTEIPSFLRNKGKILSSPLPHHTASNKKETGRSEKDKDKREDKKLKVERASRKVSFVSLPPSLSRSTYI
jgi:hypothetical protein